MRYENDSRNFFLKTLPAMKDQLPDNSLIISRQSCGFDSFKKRNLILDIDSSEQENRVSNETSDSWRWFLLPSAGEYGENGVRSTTVQKSNESLPDESWAPPLYKAAALMGLKKDIHTKEGIKILAAIDTGAQRMHVWQKAFSLLGNQAYAAAAVNLLSFFKLHRISSPQEELLFARTLILSGSENAKFGSAGERRLRNLLSRFPNSSAVRLECIRSGILGLSCEAEYIKLSRANNVPVELKVAILLEVMRLVFEEGDSDLAKYVRTAIRMSKNTRIPRWYFFNPYRPSDVLVYREEPWADMPEILAYTKKFVNHDWAEKCYDTALFLCDFSNAADIRGFCDRKNSLGMIEPDRAQVFEIAAREAKAREKKAVFFACAANFHAGSGPDEGTIEKTLLCCFRSYLNGISAKQADRIGRMAGKLLMEKSSDLKDLPWKALPDLFLCFYCLYWSKYSYKFESEYNREWDGIFNALVEKCDFRPRTIIALFTLGNSLLFETGEFAAAGKFFSVMNGAIANDGEKRLYRYKNAGGIPHRLLMDEVITKFPLNVRDKTEFARILTDRTPPASMLQWLSVPARVNLSAVSMRKWERWAMDAQCVRDDLFPPPEKVFEWLKDTSSSGYDLTYYGMADECSFTYSPWELRRRHALCLFLQKKFADAARVLRNAVDRLPDDTQATVRDTLIYDTCRMAMYGFHDKAGRARNEESAGQLQSAMTMLNSIPSHRCDVPTHIEYCRMRKELEKAFHHISHEEVEGNESFYNHSHQNQRFGRIETHA